VLLGRRLSPDSGGGPVEHWLKVCGDVSLEGRGLSACRGPGLPSIENPFKKFLREKIAPPWRRVLLLLTISPLLRAFRVVPTFEAQ
jgi:hypothetical protein